MKPNTLSLIAFVLLTSLPLSSSVRAVSPPPDGGYPRQNTAEGDKSLDNLTDGEKNTAIGFRALFSNTGGSFNTAVGALTLQDNVRGEANTATGFNALASNTTGNSNTATGSQALFKNTTGRFNIAIGVDALQNNTTGRGGTAIGFQALFNNIGASFNTANGFQALFKNTTGDLNTAIGGEALFSNTTGDRNTVLGFQALRGNTIGDLNTAIGEVALQQNTSGSSNSAFGEQALFDNTTGSFNIALGKGAGGNLTTGSHNIDIGNAGVAGEANTMRIGSANQTNTYITGISGVTVAGGVTVIVDAQGHLGTMVSSDRFKDQIKAMDKTSEAILALKPVTFRYKHELDPEGIPQFGLIAEQVEKVDPALVAYDTKGNPFTVRYEAVNAMLLNEFLKEHRKVEQLTKDFESKLVEQQKQIESLAAGLEKMSAQRELKRTAPQVAENNQ